MLDGRPFENVIVDIGFGDPPVESPDLLQGPAFLSFAGIEPIAIPALPLERHVAEKVHAYTRTYRDGRGNSRVKDLADLAIMRSAAAFDAGRLRSALDQTFLSRGTHPLPAKLPPPPSEWTTPYRRLAKDVGLDPSIQIGYKRSGAFLDPVLSGSVTEDAQWNDQRGKWDVSDDKEQWG